MKKATDPPESEPAEPASLVGERIRKIRKEEGLSLELFALRCDMNAAYVGHQLIRRVDVYRGDQLNITFNFDLTPYIERDDAAAC